MKLKDLKTALESEAGLSGHPVESGMYGIDKNAIEALDEIDTAGVDHEINDISDQTTKLLEDTDVLVEDVRLMDDYRHNVSELLAQETDQEESLVDDITLEGIRNNIKFMCDRWGFKDPLLLTSFATENLQQNTHHRLNLANENFKEFIKHAYETIKKAISSAIKWFLKLIGFSKESVKKKEGRIKKEEEAVNDIKRDGPSKRVVDRLREEYEKEGESLKNEGTILAVTETAQIINSDLIDPKDLTTKATKLSKTIEEIVRKIATYAESDLDAAEFMSGLNKPELADHIKETRLKFLRKSKEDTLELYNKRLREVISPLKKADLSDSFKYIHEEKEGEMSVVRFDINTDTVKDRAEVIIPRDVPELRTLIKAETELLDATRETIKASDHISNTLEKFLESFERSVKLESSDEEANRESEKLIKEILNIQRKGIANFIAIIQFLMRVSNIYDIGISAVTNTGIKTQGDEGGQ